jgi:hypothetical protein
VSRPVRLTHAYLAEGCSCDTILDKHGDVASNGCLVAQLDVFGLSKKRDTRRDTSTCFNSADPNVSNQSATNCIQPFVQPIEVRHLGPWRVAV